MRWPRGMVLVLIFLIAGCTGPDEETPQDPSESTPPPAGDGPNQTSEGDQDAPEVNITAPQQLPWEILDCHFVYASGAADRAAVAADIPDGFSLVGQGATVNVAFEANVCESGTGLNGSVSPMYYTSVWVGVNPPDGLGESGAFHVIAFDVMVPDAERLAWMQARGMEVHGGNVTREETGTGVTWRYTLEGVGDFQMDIGPGTEATAGGGTFDQWTLGTNGLTYWRTDWATQGTQQTAQATLQVPSGSRFADWFDVPVVPLNAFYGHWDYTDGAIIHPAPGT